MRIHRGALSSSRGNEKVKYRAVRTPMGIALAVLLSVAGLTAVGTLSAADTAPPQGWASGQMPLPSDANANPQVYTASATCPVQNQCVTVGWYLDAANDAAWGLIEMQSGSSLTGIRAPQPSNAGSGANQSLELGSQRCGVAAQPCQAVSCPTASILNCFAVGDYENNVATRQPLLETEVNGTWTARTAALPGDHDPSGQGSLLSIACTSATSCVAVGQYLNAAGVHVGLIETLTGTTWSAQAGPAPPDADPTSPTQFLGHVACGSPTSCVAVGSYLTTSATMGVIDMLSGGTWTSIGAPVPADSSPTSTFSQLFRVACPSAGACIAVGKYADAAGFPGFIDTLSGGTWTALKAPTPSNAATGAAERTTFNDVSCASTALCVAVGTYGDTNLRFQGLIDTDANGSWTAAQAPQPGDAQPAPHESLNLQSASCPSPVFCLAVGSYITAASRGAGVIETYSGGSWTAMTAPLPSNFTPSDSIAASARAVACYSAVSCTVAGAYPDPGTLQGFLDTWTGAQGYWLDASDGGIFTYPNNGFFGSTGSLVLNMPMVGMAATPDGQGYWLVAADGGIFGFGNALFHGSRGGQPLNAPIVGMASTPDGKGYWLVATDGGMFAYGDAGFFGSRGGQPLNKPIVGMAATPTGQGYWLVASDGGIFAYGDALFYGSTGSIVLNKPVVGMASSATGLGYWLVASDGGIFSYGDALFYGSTGSIVLNKPVVGMAASPSGKGYWFAASDGGVFNYGDAPFQGSAGSLVLNKPVVGMAG